MIALGQHWEFVTAAYLGSALVVAGVIGWVMFDAIGTKSAIERLSADRADGQK